MATFLITVPAVSGTILNMLPVAKALAERGHRVLVHTGERAYDKVQAAGAEFVPMPEHCNLVSRLKTSSVPVPWWCPGFARTIWRFRSEVLAIIPDMVAELEPILKREQVDCIIADCVCFSAAYSAERLGIPFVTFTSSWTTALNVDGLPPAYFIPLPPRVVHALTDFILPLGQTRKQLGLPQRPKNSPSELFSVLASKLLNLVTIHREFIPSNQLQENQVFIGPTAFEMTRTSDRQSLGASLEPGTVLVTSTTSANMDKGQFRHLVEAVAQMGIPVLAASGSATDLPSEPGKNVRLEPFVPYDEVFPYVKAVVTHGGPGTVARALRYGVPMLIIPNFGDHVPTGARAAELGLAYCLPKNKATPKAIQSKLKALLKDHALHARVKALSVKLRSMNSSELAADAIEGILPNSMMKETTKVTEQIASSY